MTPAASRSPVAGVSIAIAVPLVGLISAFMIGQYPVNPLDVLKVMIAKLTGETADVPPQVERIVFYLRGPRVLAALMVGSALATAGAAFQGLFRNPLVSPDILGASSGAALGAVI